MSKYRGDVEEEQEVEIAEPNTYGDMKIEELQLSVRATNGLKRAKINTIGDLAKLSLAELEKVKNLGKVSLKEIIEKLKEYGFNIE